MRYRALWSFCRLRGRYQLHRVPPHTMSCSYDVTSTGEKRKPSGTAVADDPDLPTKPQEPAEDDCCGSGCTPCVWDLYDDEIRQWETACARIKAGLPPLEQRQFDPRIVSPHEYRQFELVSIQRETADSCRYRLRLPMGFSLGLSAGQHLVLRCFDPGGKQVTRQYTPVSPLDTRGHFDVVIKLYSGGPMSECIRTWSEGDMTEWRGPFGLFTYAPNRWRYLLMFAAGTGIAPMAQVAHAVLGNPLDETRVLLVYSNRYYDDVLCRRELDEWSKFWNFKVDYVFTQESPESLVSKQKYGESCKVGRIDESSVRETLSSLTPDGSTLPDDVMVLTCGTKSFDKDVIKYLKLAGVADTQYFKF